MISKFFITTLQKKIYDKKNGRILLMYEGGDDEASMIFYP